ncbi:unnamed protein product [Mytilus coruscus]|uniref:Mab-21-like nucleotidyltransferase domain-containing protein n=1 Tax=Mytilus coruscus TaxID=42192 RepID=A0A6J8AG00_MYTCO|nr:unnamed protein product [Mytilus coruscus]
MMYITILDSYSEVNNRLKFELKIGTEDHVKQIRLCNAVRDYLSNIENGIQITSGSFGEGLDMRGSDLDIMFVKRDIEVYDVNPCLNQHTSYVLMDTDDVKPGFSLLRLEYSSNQTLFDKCVQFEGKLYLSSSLWKQRYVEHFFNHGPCISDTYGQNDFAECLHCKTWVPAARHWITRSNNSWPSYNVKQKCQDTIQDLQLVINEMYQLVINLNSKAGAFDLLGVALQILCDTESARLAFLQSVELHNTPSDTPAAKRLLLIGSLPYICVMLSDRYYDLNDLLMSAEIIKVYENLRNVLSVFPTKRISWT